MAEWRRTTLGEVAEEVTVGFVGTMAHEYRHTGIPFLRSQNVQPHWIDVADVKYVDDRFHKRLRKSALRAGDVVTVRTGKPGTSAVVPAALAGANCADLVITRPGPELDARWLAYYLNGSAGAFISAHLVGAVQQHFNVGAVKTLELSLPPLPEQRAIAEVLGVLDDKIAANTRLTATSESLLAAAFERLGIDRDPDVGCETRVDGLFELNPRRAKSSRDEPVYVDMQRLPTNSFIVSDWTTRPASGGTRFARGDTVMARITPCLENGKVGYIDFLGEGDVGIGSTEYIVIRSRTDVGVPLETSYFLATSPRFRANAVQNMIGSSGRQRVAAADLAGFPLQAPDPADLMRFGERAAVLFGSARALANENATLAATRDALLPALMSGRLRVRDAERAVEGAA